jgi:hypothetical protein
MFDRIYRSNFEIEYNQTVTTRKLSLSDTSIATFRNNCRNVHFFMTFATVHGTVLKPSQCFVL